MTKILNHINTYQSETDYLNDNSKDFPNVSYVEEDDIVVFVKEKDYSKDYLTFVALQNNNTVKFKLSTSTSSGQTMPARTISVSTDDGKTWTNYTSTTGGTTIATLNMGEKLLIKGNNSNYGNGYGYNYFTLTRQFDVQGNIMSLIYGDNFREKYSFPTGTTYNFKHMFYNTPVVNAENLVLPVTKLTSRCYFSMFSGCTSLVTAPALPATTLASGCYTYMFQNTNVLPDTSNIDFTSQTVLASEGLRGLFGGTKVTDADLMRILPKNSNNKYCLPVTTLTAGCYGYMFVDCKNLTTAPVLPATTLVNGCYNFMFSGCTKLQYIKAMFTTRPTSTYTDSWVRNVASTGTFVKNSAATWATTGEDAVPTGWTIQKAYS